MFNTECPNCNKETITLKQKLIANKWIDITCTECGARFCSQPIALALLSFLLTWNILYFGFLTYKEPSLTFGISFIVGWFLIEVFMYYIPLCKLRAKEKPDPSSD